MMDVANSDEFKEFFKEGDIFVFDRGFRDAVKPMSKKFRVEIPAMLTPRSKQLNCEQPYKSRKVTKVRYAVQVAIGRLKPKL